VQVRFSDRSHGDFGIDSAAATADPGSLERRRQALMGGAWTWLRQQHGSGVVVVDRPGRAAGACADGAVTRARGAVLAVQTADCAPVVVAGCGALGVAHAGWRGIAAGVIKAVVDGVRFLAGHTCCRRPTHSIRALLGPMIRPGSYEFGPDDLAAVSAVTDGREIGALTDWGTCALDLAAAVRGALRAAGVADIEDLQLDTADRMFFSHRVRGEPQRQVTAARLGPAL